MSDFPYVGQSVVCIDDSPTRSTGERELVLNRIYKLRWVGDFECTPWVSGQEYQRRTNGGPFVRVEGIVRALPFAMGGMPEFSKYDDVPFAATRFRPLTEKPEVNETGFEALDQARRNVSVDAVEPVKERV